MRSNRPASGEKSATAEEKVFCLVCFERIPASLTLCPRCGEEVRGAALRSYTQRLIAALGHPIREVRMRAIIALGLRRERKAAAALVRCAFRNYRDPVEGLEIVRTLGRILNNDPVKSPLRSLALDHPNRIVRRAARAALAGRPLGRGAPSRSSRQSGFRAD